MLRQQLKSKIHRAKITDGNVEYEGSISIPEELMQAADIWQGEKVLVASITSGNRLETYAIPGKKGSRDIVMNGAAAKLINVGDTVTIMSFALADYHITPRILLLSDRNEVIAERGF